MTENLIAINKVSDNCNMIVVNNTRIVINIGDITDADMQTILTADAILISNHDYKNYNKLMKLQEYEKQIICTIPTATLARIHLLESHCNRFEDGGTELVDDINRIIDKFTTLKYSQPYELTENLIITAYRGGLTAGNTIWKISKNDESILVFNDINHRKENIVDGLDTEILKDVTVCMLQSNDKFLKLPPKEIEQNILKTIKAHKNTIIFIKYTRLLELCSILNRNKIYANVYSSKGQDYLESMRGMVEWAGENVLKEFSDVKQVPFNYENIAFSDDLDRLTNVTVLVDDYSSNYHAFVLLDKFKDIEDTCLLFLHDEELYNFVKERKFTLKVPKLVPFTENELEVMKKEQDDKMKLEEEDRILNEFLLTKEEESDDGIYLHDKETAKKMFWYEYKTDLWIHEGEEKFATFPEPRCLRYDDYGEIFNFKYNPEIKQDVAIAHDLCTKYDLPVNKIEWADVEFNLQHEIVYFDFDGLCDFNSVKNVLEIAKPRKLVVFGGLETIELFYNFFTFNPNFSDVFLLKDEVNLNVNQVNYEILKVADDFYDKLNFKKQGSYVISGFRGKIENSELVYIDTCDNYMVCDHKIYDLKRIFVDKGFKVDLSGDVLTIEDEVVLEIVDDEISITGDLNDCYQSVRKLLYESMIMI